MGSTIFDALSVLFAGSLITDVADFIGTIMDALREIFTMSQIGGFIDIFLAIGAACMTIFLYVDLSGRFSREMLSFEQLVLVLIRYVIAMIVLIYLKEIIIFLFQLVSGLYDIAVESMNAGTGNPYSSVLEFFPDDGNSDPSVWPAYSEVQDAFESEFESSIGSYLEHMGLFLLSFVIKFFGWLAKAVAYLIAISSAIALIARAIMSPIGVVQLFDEGTRSAGILYLKKFVREGLTFFAMLIILYASSLIQANVILVLVPSIGDALTVANASEMLSGSVAIAAIAIQLSTIGAMFKAGQISGDVVGV
ncbi:hypothetical protein LKD70_09105 [Ruminococcus sp. CLA-AA-H200]|uniref:TrbL/VirB6 plasmid conjugal transfer protein n=1 Tax=Ruminococcus turbiniformis TaxID=2881258 RepID=A0ABS8FZH8_9FIRM|nr:hypothetical protein [Ruminococcus turbiniformis]MCC2254572.1 hypothetical protein [Ruminococcus turbiniformis]